MMKCWLGATSNLVQQRASVHIRVRSVSKNRLKTPASILKTAQRSTQHCRPSIQLKGAGLDVRPLLDDGPASHL